MASNYGMLMLNKAIQAESFNVFAKHGVNEDSFISNSDREVYRFLEDYNRRNGTMPSYAMVSDSVDGFTYIPDVTDKFETLAKGVLDRRATVAFNEYFQKDFANLKKETGGDTSELISSLTEDLNNIRIKYTNTRSVGKRAKDTETYLKEYQKRKSGESFKVWKSFIPGINEITGGYASANFYVLFAKSGRGKSVFALREALEAAMQGAVVLYWGLEMDYYSIMTRLYSMLSAKLGKTQITSEGRKISAGFGTGEMRQGNLSEEFEESFERMLGEINEHIPGEIVIKGIDDPSFTDRSVAQIEADALSINADMVIVDPLYLMTMESNQSKTAGGDAAATSKKIRMLSGQLDIPIIGVTQSEEGDEGGTDGVRELKVPERKDMKKTKSFLEDASTAIGIDSDYLQSRAIAGIVKGRNGGEGKTFELTYIPNYGVVEQLQMSEDLFDF